MKNIFIICVSKDTRGAKVIFVNFLKHLVSRINNDCHYYLFCSWTDILSYQSNNIDVIITKRDGIFDIFFYEKEFYKKWSLKNNIIADVIVSMQNTTINYFNGVKQIVLFQQSIPLSDIRWNPIFKNERSLFYYKNIYPFFVKRFSNKATIFIAPTKWVKERLNKKFKIPINNIIVIYSEIKYVDVAKVIPKNLDDNYYHFFYPANGSLYKNHLILLKAIKIMRDDLNIDISNVRIHFTLNNDRNNYFLKFIKRFNINNNIIFEGVLSNSEMESFYKSSHALLFPSMIESFGLPLIEAAQFGLPILTVDLPYAKEVLQQYNGASFLPIDDPFQWAKEISKYMRPDFRFEPLEIKFETGLENFIDLIHT